MNKLATSVFTVIFYLIVFVIIFSLFGAKWLADSSSDAVEKNNLSGIEAFILNNLILIVVLVALLGFLAYMYIGT